MLSTHIPAQILILQKVVLQALLEAMRRVVGTSRKAFGVSIGKIFTHRCFTATVVSALHTHTPLLLALTVPYLVLLQTSLSVCCLAVNITNDAGIQVAIPRVPPTPNDFS